jgi:hydrogenase expression/formation protein HypE
VNIVTGDTKVVDRGKGDGMFINTAGVGVIEHGLVIAPTSVRPGDVVLLSGDVGRHGVAIMAVREGLQFQTTIETDCAPLAAPVLALLAAGIDVHCLRDLTRGGLATSLIEIAESSRLHIEIRERAIAVEENVCGACEILGFDPLYLANEGRFVAFVPAAQAEQAVTILRNHPVSAGAAPIGTVGDVQDAMVTLESRIGTKRILDMHSGEQLPRIC